MTVNIGLLMDQSTSYGRGVFAGVRRVLVPHLEVRLTVADPQSTALAGWADRALDGIIAHAGDPGLLTALRDRGRPVVVVSNALDDAGGLLRVCVDDVAVGRLAAEHLRDRGLRSFAYLGRRDRRYSRLRQQGFIAALDGAPCAVHEVEGVEVGDGVGDWLAGLPHPLGLFTVGDEHALRAVGLCRARALAVPDPIAVVAGANDEQFCTLAEPALTAVDLGLEDLGAAAAGLLLALIAGDAPPAGDLIIAPRGVVARASTCLEAVADPAVAAALRCIRAAGGQAIGVDEVVAASGIGRRSLERRFVAATGGSLYRHILRVRVGLAKQLLAGGDAGLAAVARQAGFSSARHLCEAFRREAGCTPGAWRAAHRA